MITFMMFHTPSAAEITQAAEKISAFLDPTPVLTSEELNKGFQAFFKMENLVPEVFAFKIRGALNAALALSHEERALGLVTHSSGNHGAAVACVARKLQIPAYIAVPHDIPQVKYDNIAKHGPSITTCAPEARADTARMLQKKTGARFIHPFNDRDVISGQASAAYELLQQVPDLDCIIAPVGGGGLLSGTCLAAHYFAPSVEVFAGEPMEADDAFRSLASGTIQSNITTSTIADGLRSPHLGEMTFAIIRKHVQAIVRVEEDEIIAARSLLEQELGGTIEPSSAVAYAALLKAPKIFAGKRIGVIITGGNAEK